MTGAAAKKAAAAKPQPEDKVEEQPEKKAGYVVTAPRIQVTVGSQVLQFSQGDVLPNGIDDAKVKHLTGRGFIEQN